MTQRFSSQVVGSAGLFYVCYRLSALGWNVLPTTRNARGADIVIYSQSGARTRTIQVKALTKRSPVPLGSDLRTLIAQYVIVCRRIFEDRPECFILTGDEVRASVHENIKDGHKSYWLEPGGYEGFKEKWDRIGQGFE